MGFTPQQVKLMSLWEFTCAFTAWARFHSLKGADGPKSVSIDRLRELGVDE